MAGLIVKPRSRIHHGHEWVYASEVQKVYGAPTDGDVIALKDGADRMLGSAIYNSRSQIVARRISRQKQALDPDFFRRRISQAIAYRERRAIDLSLARLVWSESDGLPGMIVDRYGDDLVLQTLTVAMDQRKEMIVTALQELTGARSIVERNDAPIRKAEGLALQTGVLAGKPPSTISIEVHGVFFEIDILHGQKTGFYLDQIANYHAVAKHSHGRRVLDCFANQGGFALACAKAGAAHVTAIEISPESTEILKRNARRNALPVEAYAANVFDILKDMERVEARFDLVILDPPSFTRSKVKLQDALRGYKEIHLRALKLLAPDGVLATFCCSHHVSLERFKEMICDACVDARKTVRQLALYTQNADHPILPTIPETEYLKGFLFELAPGR